MLHPFAMLAFLVLTCVSFSLFGFIIGIWAKNFEQLQLVPLLIVSPLVFLGGAFYSISMLPPAWQTITLFNPVVYLISGFRWSFFGTADVGVGVSIAGDPRLHRALPRDRLVDVPHRLAPPHLSRVNPSHGARARCMRCACVVHEVVHRDKCAVNH